MRAREVGLSTAFASGGPTPLPPVEIVDALLRSGARGVVLDASLERERLEVLALDLERRREELPVWAVESPCPRTRESAAELSAHDRDESQVAVRAAESTIRRAAALGAPIVVLRLGRAQPVISDWPKARDLFLRGELDERQARRLDSARTRAAQTSLDRARTALDTLVRQAERGGVELALSSGRRYIELPSVQELDTLLAEWAGAPLGPLFDAAGAHLLDVMGFAPLAATLAAFGPRARLSYLGDACGPIGGLAPGRGLLDVGPLAAGLAESARIAFRPWSGLTVEETIAATGALARVVAGPRTD